MFFSMTTWLSGLGDAISGVAVAPDAMTVVMAVVAAALFLGAVLIVGEWLQGAVRERRGAKRRGKARNRPNRTRFGTSGHGNA